jgi:hypothetical protein
MHCKAATAALAAMATLQNFLMTLLLALFLIQEHRSDGFKSPPPSRHSLI